MLFVDPDSDLKSQSGEISVEILEKNMDVDTFE